MKLQEFKNVLAQNSAAHVRFLLPNGEFAPDHVHVTEVARIDKRFVDCGGILRTDALCRLQTWFSDDVEHRLTAGKLLKIFAKAEEVLLTDDLDVDVEYEVGFISQFPVETADVGRSEITLRLGVRHTACLAEGRCKPRGVVSEFDPMKFSFSEKGQTSRCC